MDHDLLKQVIYDQHQIIKNSVIIPRHYKFEENGNYVLSGLRRAGKTTLMYKKVQALIAEGIEWNQIIAINFEDERLREFKAADFNDLLLVSSQMSDKPGFFFLDEVQNIDGWEKFSRRMADAKERIWITCSNAAMLSSEIETTLGGRFLTKYISPFSFDEYLTALCLPFDEEAIATTKTRGKIIKAFQDFLEFGALPETLLFVDKREYLSSVYQKVLLGDIAARNSIRNTKALELLIKKLAESVKDPISFTRLHGILQRIGITISKDTVISYTGYAEQAYLLFEVMNFFSRFAEREGTPKHYFTDNGIMNLFLFSKNSLLLENLVAISLRRKYSGDVFFLKSEANGIDVDFYIPTTKTAIQVSYSLEDISNDREIRNLEKLATSSLEIEHFIILTMNEEGTIPGEKNTIEVLPCWKWLLKSATDND